MANPAPLISSAFGMWGDELDADECTRVTGLTPTEVELKGQPRPEGRPPTPVTHWGITLQKKELYSIDSSLWELLELVWPQREKIVEFLEAHSVSAIFCTNVTIYNERPEYCLSSRTLQRLAYFSTEYCLDIFDYSD